ncbi:ATP-grasp domain-containing protein [bacterium]|nr:ATP-grasp domain-containing protein [bacterium]
MRSTPPRIRTALIISVGNNLCLTRLPRLLKEAGIRAELFSDDRGHAVYSSHVAHWYRASREADEQREQLAELLARGAWDHIIPGDDRALERLARDDRPAVRHALPVDLARISANALFDKVEFARWAQSHSLPVPLSSSHASADSAADWWRSTALPEVIVKPARGQGGVGIFVPANEGDLRARWTGDCLVQQFIRGRTLVAEWVMRRGEPLAVVLSHKVSARGPFGFSTERRFCDPRRAEELAHSIGRLTGFSGLGGADLIERPDGTLAILEIHFRPTSCIHMSTVGSRDFAAALRGEPSNCGPVRDTTIPLFPERVVTALQHDGLVSALLQFCRPTLWRWMSWGDAGAMRRHWWKLWRVMGETRRKRGRSIDAA